MFKLFIIGVDHHGLTGECMDILANCYRIFAAKRFLPLLDRHLHKVRPISPLAMALGDMEQQLENGDVAVLASGDPLFFGIGRTLVHRFGESRVEIYPALSSMQLAFARVKESWHDAIFISLHGRKGRDMGALIFPHSKVFLFTDAVNTPAKIAVDLLTALKIKGRQEADSSFTVTVAENMGLPEERLVTGSLADIAAGEFGGLNVMIIRQQELVEPVFGLGLRENEIRHSRGLITKDEIRAVVLHKLRLPVTGVFWDIGAGSGSISLEAARMNPGLQVYAVERHQEGQANITENIRQFGVGNMTLVSGMAPEALQGLPEPERIFIGGSGGSLSGIIDLCGEKIRPSGLLVITAVTAATADEAPRILRHHGFQIAISRIMVSRSVFPAATEGPQDLNPITIIVGSR